MFWIILSRIKSNPADKSSSRAFDTISAQALEKLMPLVYGELHRLARRYMAGERPSHILQTSALVNEAYLRLVDVKNVNWQNRAHFFGVSRRAHGPFPPGSPGLRICKSSTGFPNVFP